KPRRAARGTARKARGASSTRAWRAAVSSSSARSAPPFAGGARRKRLHGCAKLARGRRSTAADRGQAEAQAGKHATARRRVADDFLVALVEQILDAAEDLEPLADGERRAGRDER